MNFDKLKNKAQEKPFSPFAKFAGMLAHKDYYKGNYKMAKWELWSSGYTNATAILNDETDIEVRSIPEHELLERYGDKYKVLFEK